MSPYRLFFSLGLVSLPLGAAQAACPGVTQMELTQCAGKEFKRAEQKLKIIYDRLPKSPELIAAQTAWLAYRDAECAYEGSEFEGGSMQPMVIALCLADLTEQRAKRLEQDQAQ